MYETQTYDAILQRMLDRVSADVDKRPGSTIYDALAPAAVELAQMYIDLNANLNLVFADTTSGEYLDSKAAELGLTRKAAEKAVRKATFVDSKGDSFDVPLGSRYGISGVTFVATTRLQKGEFEVTAEVGGTISNTVTGNLIPIEYIDGLGTATLAEVLKPGTEVESDDDLRARYFDRAKKPITSGNANHYEFWAKEIPGISDAKAIPIWDGPGTVKVVVADNDKKSPTADKIDEVANHIETVRPIGPSVTVTGVSEIAINISGNLIIRPDASLESITDEIGQSVVAYLKSIALKEPTIRYSRIANIVLDADGVIDYAGLTVNGGTGNVVLAADQVGILGAVNFA